MKDFDEKTDENTSETQISTKKNSLFKFIANEKTDNDDKENSFKKDSSTSKFLI